MTTEPSRSKSKNLMGVADAQSARPALVTVKEAAQRLGVSRSKVYRIDREIGPFRFVVDGRWIFIDQASLESHIANSRDSRTDDGLPRAGSVLPCHQPGTESDSQSEIDEPRFSATETATPSASLPTSCRGGQRELIMREHPQPFVVFYVS